MFCLQCAGWIHWVPRQSERARPQRFHRRQRRRYVELIFLVRKMSTRVTGLLWPEQVGAYFDTVRT